MPEIIPFRALRYDPHVVPDLNLVVAPPYDVISPEAQDRYHARHPHNIVRLILAKDGGEASSGGDRYACAARTFATWQAEGILRRDPEPGIYLYEQEFSLGHGHVLRRRGLLAMVRLADYDAKVIFPHERTFAKYKDDRLRLMRACPANLEAVLGFYPGPQAPIYAILDRRMREDPLVRLTDEDGIGHRLWLVRGPSEVEALTDALRDRPVVIADGHHRYESALMFRDERLARDPGPPEVRRRRLHNFILMNLVHAEDPGLVILPTHRIVKQRPALSGEALQEALRRRFRVQGFPLDSANPEQSLRVALDDLHRRDKTAVFALFGGGREILLLELSDATAIEAMVAGGLAPECARLDVAVLHRLVIEEILGFHATPEADDSIQYTRDASQALAAVASGDAHLALFLRPPLVKQVQAVALAGGRMPQKSTFFYPKVISGLVVSPLDPAELAG